MGDKRTDASYRPAAGQCPSDTGTESAAKLSWQLASITAWLPFRAAPPQDDLAAVLPRREPPLEHRERVGRCRRRPPAPAAQ